MNQEPMRERIINLRLDNNLTPQEVADALEMSVRQYKRLEKGEKKITTKLIIKLSLYYDVSSDYLICLSNDKERKK